MDKVSNKLVASGITIGTLLFLAHLLIDRRYPVIINLAIQLTSILIIATLLNRLNYTKLINGFIILFFATFYTYSFASIFGVLQVIHFMLYFLMLVTIAISCTVISYLYFSSKTITYRTKIYIATLLALPTLAICSLVGLHITRLLASQLLR